MSIEHVIQGTFVVAAEHHAVLGSTNDRARELAAQPNVQLPILIVADLQTAGRGRRSNRWWTGPGSLAFSLLLDPEQLGIARRLAPQLSLAAAVALVDTVAPLLPGLPVGLHWPNDVFASGRKLAGILVEALPDGRHIVGIGLNTNNSTRDAPEELRQTAATLLDLTGQPCEQEVLLSSLVTRIGDYFRQLVEQPETFGRRYDEHCLQRGRTLTLQHGEQAVTGHCRGIATDGALLLETRCGIRAFYGGFLVH